MLKSGVSVESTGLQDAIGIEPIASKLLLNGSLDALMPSRRWPDPKDDGRFRFQKARICTLAHRQGIGPTRQDQAHPLGWKEIKEFIETAGEGLPADRARAMLCVAYETLARRGELVALEVQDIEFWPDGTGQALIRRGKTDQAGEGRVAYLSKESVKWLKAWLEGAQIADGQVFRRLLGAQRVGEGGLHPGSVAPLFKRIGQWVGMPEKAVAELSGHSTRVGAAQDLAALNIDLAAITQAGGWKSTRMPLKYAERIAASRSAMAQAAEKTKRS